MTVVPGSAYRNIMAVRAQLAAGASGSFALFESGQIGQFVAGSAFAAFWFDPADYKVSKLRLDCHVISNAVDPLVTVWFSMRKILTWGGGSGARPNIASVDAGILLTPVVAGANGRVRGLSNVEDVPAAGWYALHAALAGNGGVVAANSDLEIRALLQGSRP